jgi:hypothetical protein
MIENIRKYTGLIIFFMALVVFALVIGIKDDLFRGGVAAAVLKIDGRTYSDKEFQQLGSGAFELASSLARSGDFGLYQFIMGLTTGATSQDDAAEKFFIGRMILRRPRRSSASTRARRKFPNTSAACAPSPVPMASSVRKTTAISSKKASAASA